jgi:predicted RNA binding protein YcfA (HicA-like mRNA interferase family)
MPKLLGVNHLGAVGALEKVGFKITRQGKHIVMTDGTRVVSIPRHNPVNAITMGNIVRDAGLTNEQFRQLL